MSSCEPSDAQSIRAHSIRVILIGPIYIRSFLIWLLDLPAGNLNRSDQNKSELPFFYFKFPNVWNYSNAMTALCVCFASDVRRMLAALSTAKHFPFFSARTFAFLITLSKSAGRTRSLAVMAEESNARHLEGTCKLEVRLTVSSWFTKNKGAHLLCHFTREHLAWRSQVERHSRRNLHYFGIGIAAEVPLLLDARTI